MFARKPITSLLAALFLLPLLAAADGYDPYPSLWESRDAGLQQELEQVLQQQGLWPAVRRHHLALVLADITDPEEPRVAEVNGNDMMYAASLPKIAILLGAFVEIQRGAMRLDGPTRAALTRMIRYSSNRDATLMLNRVGKARLAAILQSSPYHLYDPAVNGGLWVGKDYGRKPAWRRDPLHHLSHGATAMQVARFYYLLATDRLVSPDLSREMRQILSRPGIHHKFVKGLPQEPGTRLYRKSGTWKRWHADSVLVEKGDRRYILVGLAEDRHGGQWLTRLARPLDRLVTPAPTRLASAR